MFPKKPASAELCMLPIDFDGPWKSARAIDNVTRWQLLENNDGGPGSPAATAAPGKPYVIPGSQ